MSRPCLWYCLILNTALKLEKIVRVLPQLLQPSSSHQRTCSKNKNLIVRTLAHGWRERRGTVCTGTSRAAPESPALYDFLLSAILDDVSDITFNDPALEIDYELLIATSFADSETGICGTHVTLRRGRGGADGRGTDRRSRGFKTYRPHELSVIIDSISATSETAVVKKCQSKCHSPKPVFSP